MESLAHRKRFLIRNSSQDQQPVQLKSKKQEADEQSTQIINQMIINIRTLLYRTKTIKQDIEHTKYFQSVPALQPKIQEYKKFQKALLRPFFSNVPLQQSMAGAFVMRLCRQVSYWTTVLIFVIDLVNEIDGVFNQQKNANELSIELIYFLTIKKINSKADEMIKHSYDMMMISFPSQNQEDHQKYQPEVVFDMISLLAQERDKNAAKMKEMQEYMNKMISRTYKGLQIVFFQPIRIYKVEMSQNYNADALFKMQMKRNKKSKKYLQKFEEAYNFYQKKRLHQRNSVAKIEPSRSILRRNNNSTLKVSLKSLVTIIKDPIIRQENPKNVILPVLAPSRFNNKQTMTTSVSKSKINSKNRLYSSSKQKIRVKNYQKKQNFLGSKGYKLKL